MSNKKIRFDVYEQMLGSEEDACLTLQEAVEMLQCWENLALMVTQAEEAKAQVLANIPKLVRVAHQSISQLVAALASVMRAGGYVTEVEIADDPYVYPVHVGVSMDPNKGGTSCLN